MKKETKLTPKEDKEMYNYLVKDNKRQIIKAGKIAKLIQED